MSSETVLAEEPESLPPPGSYENPADEHVGCYNRTLVVAARGHFGIIRAVQIGSFHAEHDAKVLKAEIAKFVGLMTEGVYWSQHVYAGTPWYTSLDGCSDDRARHNGIWLWKWKDPPSYTTQPQFAAWDHRNDDGWTACTSGPPTKLADLPVGL